MKQKDLKEFERICNESTESELQVIHSLLYEQYRVALSNVKAAKELYVIADVALCVK